MARRKQGRPLNAVFILDKPYGLSSNAALQRTRRLFNAQKAGHTGSLDPMATGVLPICFGESTKFTQWGLDADKEYIARVRLGVTTRTGDAEGEILGSTDAGHIGARDVEKVLDQFRGPIQQIPSMFSALKYKGTPLYELARKGVEVEREPRTVSIYRLEMHDCQQAEYVEFNLEVQCSKGTYVRTLAEDIGLALGVGAHLVALRRTGAGPFRLDQAKTLHDLEQIRGDGAPELLDGFLLPADATIEHLSRVEIDSQSAEFFYMGQSVMVPGIYKIPACGGSRFLEETDIVRVVSDTGDFLGVGEVTDDSRVQPKRVVVRS
ncbi:MAG: tRNA pseudouridine(55) synthase TruB [Pseudomonadales bacterium]